MYVVIKINKNTVEMKYAICSAWERAWMEVLLVYILYLKWTVLCYW
jgi:hypothetical protein